MVLLYNIGIRIYLLLVHIVSPFNRKAALWIDGRRNWRQNIEKQIPKDVSSVWIHCSSLGEFEQGRPIIEMIKARFPELKIVLTFFSPSGYEIRKNYPGAILFFTCQLTPERMRKVLLN
jgi:3-deoxy-D-manno-octulosonic-acid transferase